MLKTRVLTALVMIAVLAGLLFFAPRLIWVAACSACAAVAAFEWSRLTKMPRIATWIFVFGNALLVACWAILDLPTNSGRTLFALAMAFWIILVPYWLWRHQVPANWAFAVIGGTLAIGSASIALIVLRDIGPGLVLGVLGVVWVSDSMAYFVGSAVGRHKLAPRISPGKTWEGVAGALAFVLLYAYLWGYFSTNVLPLQYTESAVGLLRLAGVMTVLAVMGIYGDLFESLLKRAAGVKDSGKILPGHGGALDRIDALLPVLPCAAWVFA